MKCQKLMEISVTEENATSNEMVSFFPRNLFQTRYQLVVDLWAAESRDEFIVVDAAIGGSFDDLANVVGKLF